MNVELLKPQGYCFGVTSAINLAIETRNNNQNKEIYILGRLVHNDFVIKELEKLNIKTINFDTDLSTLPKGSILIFTAHGHDEKIETKATELGLEIYDATCPIVKKNMLAIKNEIISGHQVIYIGQKNHKESIAALSISKDVILLDTKEKFDYSLINDISPLVVNQTTLNYFSLQKLHNEIENAIPQARITNEICNATRLRQESICSIKDGTDLIVIVGDHNSSNTNKLIDISKEKFPSIKSILIDSIEEIKKYDLSQYKNAVISSGTSTPFTLVKEIEKYLLNY